MLERCQELRSKLLDALAQYPRLTTIPLTRHEAGVLVQLLQHIQDTDAVIENMAALVALTKSEPSKITGITRKD